MCSATAMAARLCEVRVFKPATVIVARPACEQTDYCLPTGFRALASGPSSSDLQGECVSAFFSHRALQIEMSRDSFRPAILQPKPGISGLPSKQYRKGILTFGFEARTPPKRRFQARGLKEYPIVKFQWFEAALKPSWGFLKGALPPAAISPAEASSTAAAPRSAVKTRRAPSLATDHLTR